MKDYHNKELAKTEGSKSFKYQKFGFHQKTQLKKQISLQYLDRLNKKQDNWYGAYNNDHNRFIKNGSESSLHSLKSPRKICMTPRKQMLNNSSSQVIKQKKASRNHISQVVLQLKILLKDFEQIVNSFEKQIATTIKKITNSIEQQIKKYISKQIKIIKSNLIQQQMNSEMRRVDQMDISLQEITQQHETEKKKVAQQLFITPRKVAECEEGTQNSKAGSFSSMIKLRQKIRKEATMARNTKPKLQDQREFHKQQQQGLNALKSHKEDSQSRELHKNHTATRSIQKLQKQLSSLKNLLYQ